MEVLKYQLNDNYQACHIKIGENPLFFNSTISLVYHSVPGDGSFSWTVLEIELKLQKFKMPNKDLVEIENSIYTGVLEFYIQEKEHLRKFRTCNHSFFLNGIFVSPEIFLRINNRLGVSYKNQTDNSLSKIADKLLFFVIPLFMFVIEQGNDYAKELLKKTDEEILSIINESRRNPVYKY